MRLVKHGAAQGEALLPPAGKLRSQAIEIWAEAVELNDFAHTLPQAFGREAVDAAVEGEIFGDGEVGVEAEILGHVADVFADALGIVADVDALNRCVAATERKKPGEHLDDGSFAAAVGAKKAEDFAFLDTETHIVDGSEVAETTHQVAGGDSGLVGGCHDSGAGLEGNVGGHPGEDAVGRIVDADFHAKDLVNTFLARLHVTGQKFGLLIDLFDDTRKSLIGE